MSRALAVCTGRRCAALLPAGGEAWAGLREATQASRGALLISTGCPGSCAMAPVVAVSDRLQVHQDPELGAVRATLGAVLWLGPVGPEQVRALCAWVGQHPDRTVLPGPLRRAVFVPEPA